MPSYARHLWSIKVNSSQSVEAHQVFHDISNCSIISISSSSCCCRSCRCCSCSLFVYRFWPVIDDALRKASLERGVKVRILASQWKHTKHDMIYFLRSLSDVSGAMKADIQVVSDLSWVSIVTKSFFASLLLLCVKTRVTHNDFENFASKLIWSFCHLPKSNILYHCFWSFIAVFVVWIYSYCLHRVTSF